MTIRWWQPLHLTLPVSVLCILKVILHLFVKYQQWLFDTREDVGVVLVVSETQYNREMRLMLSCWLTRTGLTSCKQHFSLSEKQTVFNYSTETSHIYMLQSHVTKSAAPRRCWVVNGKEGRQVKRYSLWMWFQCFECVVENRECNFFTRSIFDHIKLSHGHVHGWCM